MNRFEFYGNLQKYKKYEELKHYGIDGIDGTIEISLYRGGGSIKNLNDIKLDDIL